MYLNDALVELSFKRLSSRKDSGKTPLERTSALMYFLAFDATVKKLGGKHPLDMNPRTFDGKNNRQVMELEFVRFVKLKNTEAGKIRQVSVLGRFDTGGTQPEKRLSSNFFTVPLKKATQSSKLYPYPNRPAPVFKMGQTATGSAWGMDYFDEWEKNLPELLADVKSNTPFTDLGVFAAKDTCFEEGVADLCSGLHSALKARFSAELSAFWIRKMETEKVFLRHAAEPYQTSLPNPFPDDGSADKAKASDPKLLKSLEKDALVDRIVYLEGILDVQSIDYRALTT